MYLYNLDKLVFTKVTDRLVLEVLERVTVMSFIDLLQTDTDTSDTRLTLNNASD